MKTKIVLVGAVYAVFVCLASPAGAETPYHQAWTRQVGTSDYDGSFGVAADGAGNVFIGGYTEGSLSGTNQGLQDAFVSKYDTLGNFVWTRQLGTSYEDIGRDVATDRAGNVLISGWTDGSLNGQPSAPGADAFVSKYNSSGNHLWTQQLGTGISASARGYGVTTDFEGNVFVCGHTAASLAGQPYAGGVDTFVSKYTSSGNLLWTRLLGTSEPEYSDGGIAADADGNVFVGGMTYGNLVTPNAGGGDAFVRKYSPSGSVLWTRQAGTSDTDIVYGIAVDAEGNAFVSGRTDGDLAGEANSGGSDAFLSKYDTAGALLWTRLLGTSGDEYSRSAATDAAGNVFISGVTTGTLGGLSFGGDDAFVSKYDTLGNLLWTQQLGTPSADQSWPVTTDADGNVLTSGFTQGSLGGPNEGDSDAFVAKYVVPEPATLGMVMICAVGLLKWRR